MSTYEINRVRFPADELKKYDGQWVAFSRDGTCVLAGAATLTDLEELLVKEGKDPQQVAFERIEFEDGWLGGVELG